MLFPKKRTIFAQGDPADAVFYLQAGKIKLAVVSKTVLAQREMEKRRSPLV